MGFSYVAVNGFHIVVCQPLFVYSDKLVTSSEKSPLSSESYITVSWLIYGSHLYIEY